MTPIRPTYITALAAGLLATVVAACTDDFDSVTGSGRQITFDIAETSAWSRSGSADGPSLSTVTLKADSRTLYLIPEVTRGVNVDKGGSRGSLSRSAAVTASSIETIGVYASTSGADAYYMSNVEATRANDWAPAVEYLWPGSGSLHINAYSPWTATAASETDGGIVALPSGDPTDSPRITYSVPADVTAQTDLLRADPRDASASPCALRFNHALAAVKFVTGAEMAPCTVKSITISGIAGRGVLDLESGNWSDLSGSAVYTVSPDAVLTADADSSDGYVAEGTPITDGDNTFMLLPQTLGKDSRVTLTIQLDDGSTLDFNASIEGQTWQAGNTYTYRLSATPDLDRLIITAESPLSFNYTGGTRSYSVTSRHEKLKDGVLVTEEVPWTAEFVDETGNVVPTPQWISAMTMEGDGSTQCEATTRMVEPDFVSMSEPTRRLRSRAAVGSTESPYNLSNSSGAQAVENTANCYVINAPGTYSIPLVYGNAIKNGADNTAAYVPTRTRAPFVNHLGNRIKKPYIYENSGCENPADAILVWEGRLNMVRDVRLSADRKSIVFDVPAASIRQGNAVVGVRDASGEIMWSWQLWVTDYIPGEDLKPISYNGKTYQLMPYNLGRVIGGDETDFASSTALLRLTQHPVDGSQGRSVTITVEQTGKHVITPDCHSFYQWGRKDPMISGIKEWYYADHTEITDIETRVLDESGGSIGSAYDAELVRTPQVFWILAMSGNPVFTYTNNWNIGTTARPVKTVYDPCPVGFMVPGTELMAIRDLPDTDFSFRSYGGYADPAGFTVTNATTDGSPLFFPALGYRSGKSGSETVTSSNGSSMTELWTSHANTREAVGLVLKSDTPILHSMPDEARLEAFGIRPVHE